MVIGGMAVIQAGYTRTTEDIDLLGDTSSDNIARVRQALRSLPDRAVDDMADATSISMLLYGSPMRSWST